ncbi:MAG: hypothetical protein JO089_07980 [Alphaproteobacteria bacterium]|nr:hypothetical protein [Alphaproteobacteria bacterium]
MRWSGTVASVALVMAMGAGAAGAQDVPTQYNQRHYFPYHPAGQDGGAPAMASDAAAASSGLPAYDSAAGGALESGSGDFPPPVEDTVKEQNGIRYLSGGIGDEELAVIKAHEHEFNLKVLTTAPNGEFIGTYTLRVMAPHGNSVFEAPGDGPLFYLKLPAGNYIVEEDKPGTEGQRQRVVVGNRGMRTARFYWSPSE